MQPAYCVSGSKEIDHEMTNVIRNSVVITSCDSSEHTTTNFQTA